MAFNSSMEDTSIFSAFKGLYNGALHSMYLISIRSLMHLILSSLTLLK